MQCVFCDDESSQNAKKKEKWHCIMCPIKNKTKKLIKNSLEVYNTENINNS